MLILVSFGNYSNFYVSEKKMKRKQKQNEVEGIVIALNIFYSYKYTVFKSRCQTDAHVFS